VVTVRQKYFSCRGNYRCFFAGLHQSCLQFPQRMCQLRFILAQPSCGAAFAGNDSALQETLCRGLKCDPRRNKLLTEGSKGDKPDARRLAGLLRVGMVRSVWHGHEKTRTLKEMVRAYETFTRDTNRTMLRIKAIYRSRFGRRGRVFTRPHSANSGWERLVKRV
jgi:hypothetical protein